MRIVASLDSNEIIQVEGTPKIGDTVQGNGRYLIDIPAGEVPIDSTSYILPVDGGDVSSLGYQNLLNAFPVYSNIVFNPLLTTADIAQIDTAGTLDNSGADVLPAPYDGVLGSRVQSGRSSGILPGNSPGSTALFPVNSTTTPQRPGLLITDTIDISAQTGGLGASNFMLYWKVYKITVSEDINSDFGIFAGVNTPAIKTIEEIDQEDANLTVAISTDDGGTYTPVSRLTASSGCGSGTLIRVAFLNTGTDKIYVSSYAVLF